MRRAALCLTLSILFTACGFQNLKAEAQPVRTTPPPCDRACWLQRIEQQQNERIYWAEVVKQQKAAAAYRRLLAFAAAVERARRAAAAYPHGLCGGDLPPCYVMRRESGGNIRARNPRSTASGKWQALDSTWRRFGGYRSAWMAPERVQDDFARRLWNHGRGCSHWSAC